MRRRRIIGGCFGMHWSLIVKKYSHSNHSNALMQWDFLMTSNPKAIQHILHNSGYRYPKTEDVVHMWEMVVRRGLLTTTGSIHQCQRKILNPAFSLSQLKEYICVFHAIGAKVHSLSVARVSLYWHALLALWEVPWTCESRAPRNKPAGMDESYCAGYNRYQ